jgi:tetratricopeptide (TPR) repeat protein
MPRSGFFPVYLRLVLAAFLLSQSSAVFAASASTPSAPKAKIAVTTKKLAPMVSKKAVTPQTPAATDGLQALLNNANAAANKKDYPQAIALYEQAVAKASGEKTFKHNLSVLYANYGVGLEEKGEYAAAQKALDKSLALSSPQSQEATSVREAKAGAYYSEAMALRSTLQAKDENAPRTATELASIRTLLNKAIALSPQQGVYKQGMANTYLDEAYDLANQEHYTEALPILEKARTYDPDSDAVQESLANVYLGLARNDVAHRQVWIDKALATDKSPQIQQTAAQLKAAPRQTQAGDIKKKSFATSPGATALKPPPELSHLSVLGMIEVMEGELGLHPAPKATLQTRLEAIEKPVLGQLGTGLLTQRSKAAYTVLMGKSATAPVLQAKNLPAMAEPLSAIPEDTYLDKVFAVTDGKVVRWGRFPLRLYFDVPVETITDKNGKTKPVKNQTPGWYKPEYRETALAGFNLWNADTGGFARIVEVKNPAAADILVHWAKEPYTDRFAKPETKTTDVYKNYVPPKHSKTMRALQVASMATPGYLSLAPQALNAALQYKEARKLELLRTESTLTLGLGSLEALSPQAAKVRLQNISAREFGHALGIKGISPNAADLMSTTPVSDSTVQSPTMRDLNTLRALYDRPANIVLNTR